MKWKRAISEEIYGGNYIASDEGEVIVTLEERLILAQCGLSVEKYIEAKTPNFYSVSTSGIKSYCFNCGWYVEFDSSIDEWCVVGRIEM